MQASPNAVGGTCASLAFCEQPMGLYELEAPGNFRRQPVCLSCLPCIDKDKDMDKDKDKAQSLPLSVLWGLVSKLLLLQWRRRSSKMKWKRCTSYMHTHIIKDVSEERHLYILIYSHIYHGTFLFCCCCLPSCFSCCFLPTSTGAKPSAAAAAAVVP